MPSRRIEDLRFVMQSKVERFIEYSRWKGIELIVTSTLRTYEEQDKLYAIGRTQPGKIITKAKAGYSWHNFGLAIDVVPVIHGKPVWEDANLWKEVGGLGKAQGFLWGGDWESFIDKPHFEYHPDITLEIARQRKADGVDVLNG